ncbi:hypothetical protein GGS21DRAFT_492765 [Xylaria nigripes]|nr:hypothetical protein GGS21DRAFT_492765 [Xylaria nigripes]
MKALSGLFNSWSYHIFQCCRPQACSLSEKPHDHGDLDTSFAVIRDEPSFVPSPSTEPFRHTNEIMKEERASRKSRGSGWSSFSGRTRLSSPNTPISPRPFISAPSNFRHVYSESFQFPDNTPSQPQLQRTPFRPLELNIALFDTQFSVLLPQLDDSSAPITPPPRAHTAPSPRENYIHTISHERSYSSMSFQIPRRPVNDGSGIDSIRSNTSTPKRSQLTMTRNHTPPPVVEDLVKRVAHAMLERDRLQEQLDDIVERQSTYIKSRPSTAHGPQALSAQGDASNQQHDLFATLEMEAMPEIPAMPPNAPSFSERLSSDRPRSTSAKSPTRTQYQANSSRKIRRRAPPPPLPLQLRPPLRKKKSFARVSSWFFPSGMEHRRERSFSSLTNEPMPVTDRDGFYQVARPEPNSFDSESTISEWTTEDEQNIPSTLSPSSVVIPRSITRPRRSLPVGWREPIRFQQHDNVAVAF